MDIDSGAASTEIVFEKYPTEVKIGAGASSFALYFPFGYQVKLEIDGGAISKDLNGFVKIDDFYFSQGYEEGSDSITVSIDAGAVSIDAGFYTAEGIQ